MSTGTPITKITASEIELLEPDDVVDLLRCLLHCEARALQIWSPDLDVPSKIRVPDGGMDGYWDNRVPEKHAFIPRQKTFYQCKAQRLTDKLIESELLEVEKRPRGAKSIKKELVVKPRVREVLEAGGCYAFLTTDHGIRRRTTASQQDIAINALRKAGFSPPEDAKIVFLNGSKLADWTNKFAAAVALVRQRTKQLGGIYFCTVDEWSKQPYMQGAYCQNEILQRHREWIRNTLLKSKSAVIRISCLSGLGKTRLALEALRPQSPDDQHGNHLAQNTVYLSYQEHEQDAINLIQHLAGGGYTGIVVLDDCPPSVHESIVNKVSGKGISFVTIYHELEPARSQWPTLQFSPDEIRGVVIEILKASPGSKELSDEAIQRIAEFSQGFPQIARMILDFKRTPPIEEFRKLGGIASKLLGYGNAPDGDLEDTLSAISLFRRIGGAAAKLFDDLEFIRSTFVGHLTQPLFLRKLQELKDRRIVQEIAHTIVVTPRPLATAFAARLIETVDPSRWKEGIEQFEKHNLVLAFAQRIEEIEFSDRALEIGKLLLESGIPFADAEYLLTGQAGARIFRALTVLNPAVAMKLLERAIADADVELLRCAQEGRRDILHALEVLVWHVEHFHDAGWIILRLAAAENERWSNNATGVFKGLFHVGLSGTQMPGMDRLPLVEKALGSEDEEIRKLAVDALGEGLSDGSFSRMSDTTLAGKRDAYKDWSPKNLREQLDYWKACFLMLKGVVEKEGDGSAQAKSKIAHHLHGIISSPLITELEGDFRSLCERFGSFWPEAKDTLRSFANIQEGKLLPEHVAALDRWIGYLQPPPTDIASRISDIVRLPGWHHRQAEGGGYTDISQMQAVALADECIAQKIDLRPYLELLLSDEQQQGYAFGAQIARGHPGAKALLEAALEHWPSIEPKRRNSSFLRGFAKGLETREPERQQLLERVAECPEWCELLVPLTTATTLVESDFKRIAHAIVVSTIPAEAIQPLAYGSVTKDLPPEFVLREATCLLDARPNVAAPLFKVLTMYCHGVPKNFVSLRPLFLKLVVHENIDPMEHGGQLGWEWCETSVALVTAGTDQSWLKKLTQRILKLALNRDCFLSNGNLERVTQTLLSRAPKIVWPIFSKALERTPRGKLWSITEFLCRSGGRFDESGSPLWELPPDMFRAWLQKNRKLVPLLLSKMHLCRAQEQPGPPDGPVPLEWHPHALILLEEGVSDRELANALDGNLLSFGSVGSRIPYLQERLKLTEKLHENPNKRLQSIARMVQKAIESTIEWEEQNELRERAQFL